MADLGVDENMSLGPDRSVTDGYESSSSREDVFAKKKVQKVKRRTKTNRHSFALDEEESLGAPGNNEEVFEPETPEVSPEIVSDNDSAFSADESFSGSEDVSEDDMDDNCEDDDGGNASSKASEVFAPEGESDVILFGKRFCVTIYRFVSKDAPGANFLLNVLFLPISNYFQLYSTVILQLNNLPRNFQENIAHARRHSKRCQECSDFTNQGNGAIYFCLVGTLTP